jgi:hypothetical protein
MQEYYLKFISGLEDIYGEYNKNLKKFSKKSNSIIARDLFYSDSQFSRLINQTASEGEYKRANKIISRYKENIDLKNQLVNKKSTKKNPFLKTLIPFALLIVIAFLIGYVTHTFFNHHGSDETSISNQNMIRMDNMLYWAFELSDVKPYVELNDLPDDCIYPCYRLQGKWHLKDPYKLPLFGDKRGFHYLASEVRMYARCMSEVDNTGKELEGFEYQKHEIWYDKNELPIDSFMVSNTGAELKQSYKNSDFSKNENFVLVAYIHTFFRNVFSVEEDNIKRKGKVIGRYIEYMDLSEAKVSTINRNLEQVKDLIREIVNKRVGDFSKPISCSDAELDKPSIYDIEENDLIKFQCTMTTGRLPISYEKKYILVDQFIKNACRPEQTF